ncbi:MAG: envelope biogenesis factor ElyC [Pseudomonadales bacterium]|nr:envelope biogenesis factor ElyC [Pseudomonadales bacterium]
MFIFKKIIATILLPFPLALIGFGIGLYLLWFTKWQRLGKLAMTLGVLILLIFSSAPVSYLLVSPLEYRYPAYDVGNESVNFVVVLGSGHVSDPRLPVTSQIGSASLVRLIEGIRIYKANPGAKLIVSGAGGQDPVPNAEVVANVALALGVPRVDIIEEPRARDTANEAKLIKEIIEDAPFALVTSANHMPRAVALFRKQGLSPIPAPTNYFVKNINNQSFSLRFSAGSLQQANSAIHEYLGLAWAKLRGQID